MYIAFTEGFEDVKLISDKNISQIDNKKYISAFKLDISLDELLAIEKLTFTQKMKVLFS